MKRRRKDDGFGETQKEAPAPEPVCKPWRWRICLLIRWPLIGYFLWNPDLWDIKCEVNPPAITSRKQKVWNGGETWNCTHLRVRSVYLGLAKRRQRRKREKQPKRSPARQWLQRNSWSPKWRQQKARREGIQRYLKQCVEGGIGEKEADGREGDRL